MQANEESYIVHLKELSSMGESRPFWDFIGLPVSHLKIFSDKDTRFNIPSRAEGPMAHNKARSRLFSLYTTKYYRDRDPPRILGEPLNSPT